MPIFGLIGSIFSSSNQADAAEQASQEQYQAAQLAAQTQLTMFDKTQSNLAPYLQTGTSALANLSRLFGLGTNGQPGTGATSATAQNAMSALQQYPGYQFQFQQGQQALDRSAAARGLLTSGGQVKDSINYGQGAAQSAWGQYLASLGGLSSLGENAGAAVGNAATTAGQGIASSQLAGGQALAAGTVGTANATTAGIQGGLQSALYGYQNFGTSPTSGLYNLLTTGSLSGISSSAPALNFTPTAQDLNPTLPGAG